MPTHPPGPARAVLLVFAGGCAGGGARHLLTLALPASQDGPPWGLLVANVAGALLLGCLLSALPSGDGGPGWARPALGTGFCGAFTTMSAVSVSAAQWALEGSLGAAVLWWAANLGAGLIAVGIGAGVGSAAAAQRRGVSP